MRHKGRCTCNKDFTVHDETSCTHKEETGYDGNSSYIKGTVQVHEEECRRRGLYTIGIFNVNYTRGLYMKGTDCKWELYNGNCAWGVYMGSVHEECTWRVYMESIDGECTRGLYIGSVHGECT